MTDGFTIKYTVCYRLVAAWFSPFCLFYDQISSDTPSQCLDCSAAFFLFLLSNTRQNCYRGMDCPAPFNIKYKKDMSTGGWQLTVGNHIRWPLHCFVCVCVLQWDTEALQGSGVNERPCCWQETKYCCIKFHTRKKWQDERRDIKFVSIFFFWLWMDLCAARWFLLKIWTTIQM